jgi:hypothetical protein
MKAVEQERKPRRIWLKIVAGLVVIVLAVGAWVVIERYRAKAGLAKYEKESIAKGEKLTFAELLPPSPEGNKGAEALALCSKLQITANVLPTMRLIAAGKAMVTAKQSEWRFPNDKATYTWQSVVSELKANEAPLQELRVMVRSPVLRSSVQYNGANTLWPHLAPYKRGAQWLSASAMYNIRAGNLEAAVHDIEAVLLLARVLEEEPFLISQLVRVAMVNIALNACWAFLQADHRSDEVLSRLQDILSQQQMTASMIRGLKGERVFGRDAVAATRASSEDVGEALSGFAGSSDESSPALIDKLPYHSGIRDAIQSAIIVPMWRFAWSYEDQRHIMEEVDRVIGALKKAEVEHSAAPLKKTDQLFEEKMRPGGDYQSWRYWATRTFAGGIANTGLRAIRDETHVQLAITATAMKRYRIRHGKYPQTLDELVPELLPKRPVDWMDGQKLRYRVEGDSFVLWSIGKNGVDEGGTPDQSEPYSFYDGPDMVWPRAAAAAEVEQYYERMNGKR